MLFISTILATSIGIYKEGGEEKCTDTYPCFMKKHSGQTVDKMEIEQTESETKFLANIELKTLNTPADGLVCRDCASNILTINRILPFFENLSYEGEVFNEKKGGFVQAFFTIPICKGAVFGKKSKGENFDTFLILLSDLFYIFTVKNERCEIIGIPNETFVAACDFKLCPAVHMLKMIEKYKNEKGIKYYLEKGGKTDSPYGLKYAWETPGKFKRIGFQLKNCATLLSNLGRDGSVYKFSATFSDGKENFEVQGKIEIKNGKLMSLDSGKSLSFKPMIAIIILCATIWAGIGWYFFKYLKSE